MLGKIKILNLSASIIILLSLAGCWSGMDNFYYLINDPSPLISVFNNVTVVESVLCSGPTEDFDAYDPSTYNSPDTFSEVFYCVKIETDVPDTAYIAWFYNDEEFAFAYSPGQSINESGNYYFSLKDSVSYSHFVDYNGEFSLENQIKEGSLRVHVVDDRNTIKEETLYLQPNSPNQQD